MPSNGNGFVRQVVFWVLLVFSGIVLTSLGGWLSYAYGQFEAIQANKTDVATLKECTRNLNIKVEDVASDVKEIKKDMKELLRYGMRKG